MDSPTRLQRIARPGVDARPPSASTLVRSLRIAVCVMALAWVGFISVSQQVSNDFWLQAKIGELIVQHHAIPDTVLFAFTEIRNATFHAHEWLPSLAFYAWLQGMGEASLPLVNGLLGCLLFGQTARLVYQRSQGDLARAVALALLALAVENYRHVLRPELLSLGLFLLCLDCLSTLQRRCSAHTLALFALGTLVWANVHGSFFLAPLMALAFALGERLDRWRRPTAALSATPARTYAWLALGAGLCTLANPVGLALWEFVLHFSQASMAKQDIIEWIPTFDARLHPIRGVAIGMGAMALLLLWLWRQRHRIGHAEVLLALFFLALACSASRFLVYLGFVAAFVAAPPSSAPVSGQGTPAVRPLAWVLLGCLVLWGLVWRFGNANGLYPSSNPDLTKLTPGMVQALADPALQGPVLVSYGLGAELIYRAYPRLQPSIDSRLDSYGDAYYYMHEALWSDPAALQRFVQRYQVRYVLADQSDFGLLQDSGALDWTQWQVLGMDYKAVLLQHTR